MERVRLIYFEGCPNAGKARALLESAGIAFEAVRQDDLPPGHPLRGYVSPTILLGDRILHGMRSESPGCSVAPLDEAGVRAALAEALGA